MRKKQRKEKKADIKPGKFDRKLFFITILLTILGLIALANASAPLALERFSDKYYFLKQQLVWALAGIFLMIVFSKLNYKIWERYATPIFFLNVFLLLVVFIPGLGIKVLGATRWIDLGFFSFQPSEFIKFTLVVYLAKVFSKNKKISAYIIPLIIVASLIMLQPDLGTTLVITGTAMAQIFASGAPLLRFFFIGVIGVLTSALLIWTSDYRKERLLTFLKISQDPLDSGYHIRQVLIALGSGGLWGVGLGQSRQKYLFLPETPTDSIFAVVAEEVGFIGALVLLSLIGFYIFKGFQIAKRAPDPFSFMLSLGVTSWIGIQFFLNIGSMVALVPLTGIPLPFISYGGTALVTILSGTGILLNISKHLRENGKQ